MNKYPLDIQNLWNNKTIFTNKNLNLMGLDTDNQYFLCSDDKKEVLKAVEKFMDFQERCKEKDTMNPDITFKLEDTWKEYQGEDIIGETGYWSLTVSFHTWNGKLTKKVIDSFSKGHFSVYDYYDGRKWIINAESGEEKMFDVPSMRDNALSKERDRVKEYRKSEEDAN